jgi:hypothetical protein
MSPIPSHVRLKRLRREHAALTEEYARLERERCVRERSVYDTHAHYAQDERWRNGHTPRLIATVALMSTHMDDWDAVATSAESFGRRRDCAEGVCVMV